MLNIRSLSAYLGLAPLALLASKEISRILAVWKCFRRKGRKKDAMKMERLSKNTVKGADCKEERYEGWEHAPSQDSGSLVQDLGLPSEAAAHPLPARPGW